MRAEQHPLHVVQISRDTGLLRPSADSEPVQRQLEYARELDRRAPGGSVTIIVLAGPATRTAGTARTFELFPFPSAGRFAAASIAFGRFTHSTRPRRSA